MLKHYLTSNKFKLDLISLLPFDLFYFITGPVSAWRIIRLLKAKFIFKLKKKHFFKKN